MMEALSLVLTDEKKYWPDLDARIVFLGPWCKKYEDNDVDMLNIKETLPYIWERKETVYSAREYIYNDLYSRLVHAMAKGLGDLHGREFSNKYWEILISGWLKAYLSITFSKYSTIKQAITKYPTIKCYGGLIGTKRPVETTEGLFDQNMDVDLYSRILLLLKANIHLSDFGDRELSAEIIARNAYRKNITESIKKNIKKTAYNILWELTKEREILIRESYCRINNDLKLIVISNGKIGLTKHVVDDGKDILSKAGLDVCLRDRRVLMREFEAHNEYEELLVKLIVDDIPLSFVEGFGILFTEVEKKMPQRPKVIASATEWYWNDYFKIWGAMSKEKGAILIELQHGGNYGSVVGISEYNSPWIDRFITWGWVSRDINAIKGVATKMINQKQKSSLKLTNTGKEKRRGDILYVTYSVDRINDMVLAFPRPYHGNIIESEIAFIENITPNLRGNLLIRPYFSDYGWMLKERIESRIGEIRYQGYDVRLKSAVKNCRIFVTDQLSTTFLEALYENVPTILFWPEEAYLYTDESRKHYKMLRDAGILHSSAEEAANIINEVYDSVEEWWNASNRQRAISIFCNEYVYVPQKPLRVFIKALEDNLN